MKANEVIDWEGCRHVVILREGAVPTLRDDPHVMADAIVSDLDDGASINDIVRLYSLKTPLKDLHEVYKFVREQRAHRPRRIVRAAPKPPR